MSGHRSDIPLGFGAILGDVASDLKDLVGGEIRLARVELDQKLRRVIMAAVFLLGGALVAFAGLVVFLQGIAAALALVLSTWAASLIVGILIVVIGGLFARSGLAMLSLKGLISDPDFQGVVVARCLVITLALAFVVAVMAIHDAWVWSHPPQSKYFLTDGRANFQRAIPLDSPIVDDQDMLQWTVRWVLAPYNVNYHDFPVQLNTAGQHYSIEGWRSFATSYINQGNFDKMKEARLLCYAQATRAAVVRATEIKNGHLYYAIQIPIVQTCQNVNQDNSENLMMDATVERVDDVGHPDGLAIVQLVATLR